MLKKKSTILLLLTLGLAVYGSFMIISADLGNHVGSTDAFFDSAVKQGIILMIGAVCFVLAYFIPFDSRLFNIHIYEIGFVIFGFLLCIPRILGNQVNGAYAWINIGSFSLQISEFAKVFSIVAGARIMDIAYRKKDKKMFHVYGVFELALILIVILLQNDTGTAIIMLGIVYCILLATTSKETKTTKLHNWMMAIILVGIAGLCLLFVPEVNEWLGEHSDGYIIGRILSANNPFDDQYNTGYHMVMSLTAIATGGWTGLGYGQSIHKFMNFPNPSTDFILAVIIEETGILGFLGLCVLYLGIMIVLAYSAYKTVKMKRRIILFGTFVYFFLHFVLNVGGVSALIPLTGVPLLMVSSGGSSTIASMMALGFCFRQLREIENEDNRREVQEINA